MADALASTSAPVAADTALHEPAITAEDQAQAVQESQAQCQAVNRAREAMAPSDRAQLDSVKENLRPHFNCNHCKNLLMEPWLVKDCGHLYCFRCLHGMVYNSKVKHCPACGMAGGDSWTQDSFGSFRVVVDANKARKVARDGSRFLYDDPTDSLIRMLWPERATDYVQVDLEREQRRAEDLEARKKFEISVHGDRLVNPSATNPGMAAGRYNNAGGGTRSRIDRLGTRLRPPPLAAQLALGAVSDSLRASRRAPPAHVRPVLLMPMQNAACPRMREWSVRSGLMDPAATLPALLKPYLTLPLERTTVRDMKQLLTAMLVQPEYWHDRLRHYPAAEAGLTAENLLLFVEWSQCSTSTPDYVMAEELIEDQELERICGPGQADLTLLSVQAYLETQSVTVEQSIDLIYCLRPAG